MNDNEECVEMLQYILNSTEHLSTNDQKTIIDEYMSIVAINSNSSKGFTPLFYATALGNHKLINLLIDYGADPNISSKFGQTPIFCAAENDQVHIAAELVRNGANINVQDHYGKTPLMFAAGNGNLETTKFLVSNGGNINLTDKDGNTSLHYAFKIINKDVVKYLIDNGADMDIKNNKGISGNVMKQVIVNSYNKKKEQEIIHSKILPDIQMPKKESTKFRDMVMKSREGASKNRGR